MPARTAFIYVHFGERYCGMLFTSIYSLRCASPECEILVFWQNCADTRFREAIAKLDRVRFFETSFKMDSGSSEPSLKTRFLEFATATARQMGFERAVFLDSDLIVLRPITYVAARTLGISVTLKKDKWPLNTGIIFANLTDTKTTNLLLAWRMRTDQILASKELSEISRSPHYPYGGGDQMALCELLHISRNWVGGAQSEVTDSLPPVAFLECAVYNETNSVTDISERSVLHYKGGWHRILLDGEPFHKHRTLFSSYNMYIVYMTLYKRAIQELFPGSNPFQIGWFASPKFIRENLQFSLALYCRAKLAAVSRAVVRRIKRHCGS